MRYEHGATADGRLVFVRARIVLDGGAYASSSTAVCSNAGCFAAGPYEVPNARIDSYVTYTNNPPCGAMRGFGAVQVAIAHEAQMDKLAAALGIDPVELRIANARRPGSRMPTGQVISEPAPGTELGVDRVAVLTADTQVGSAGSSSASRQTYVTGGAVKAACEAVRDRLPADPRTMSAVQLAALLGDDAIEETVEWRHRETHPL